MISFSVQIDQYIIIKTKTMNLFIQANYFDEMQCQNASEGSKLIQSKTQTIESLNQVESSLKLTEKAKRGNQGKPYKGYYWSAAQNKRYIQFLKQFKYIFDLPRKERIKKKVNLLLSKKVKSRNAKQCHTHHQKMMKKYGDIQNIIQMYQLSLNIKEGQNIEQKCNDYQLDNLEELIIIKEVSSSVREGSQHFIMIEDMQNAFNAQWRKDDGQNIWNQLEQMDRRNYNDGIHWI